MILFIWGQYRFQLHGNWSYMCMWVSDHLEVEDAEKLIAVHAGIALNILLHGTVYCPDI